MGEAGEFMLFGVRVVVDSLRKSVSLNNLSQYELRHVSSTKPLDTKDDLTPSAAALGGYGSADEAAHHPHHRNSSPVTRGERKRGVPWTEEEHKLFLLGLKRVGKGDWRGISRNFVKTRTPTQVASHAQKYFLRSTNLNRRRRRSSLFDITTDAVSAIPMEEEQIHDQNKNNAGSASLPLPSPQPETSTFKNLLPGHGSDATITSRNLIHPVVLPAACASPICNLNLDLNLTSEPSPIALNLSLASDRGETSSRHLAFQGMRGYNNGDSMISVA